MGASPSRFQCFTLAQAPDLDISAFPAKCPCLIVKDDFIDQSCAAFQVDFTCNVTFSKYTVFFKNLLRTIFEMNNNAFEFNPGSARLELNTPECTSGFSDRNRVPFGPVADMSFPQQHPSSGLRHRKSDRYPLLIERLVEPSLIVSFCFLLSVVCQIIQKGATSRRPRIYDFECQLRTELRQNGALVRVVWRDCPVILYWATLTR